MKKSQLSRREIESIIREYEDGRTPSVVALCEKYGVSRQAFYNWRIKYSTAKDANERIKRLEAETRQLRRVLQQQSLLMRTLQQRFAPELLAPVDIDSDMMRAAA